MGGIVITNDGHCILREVDVSHPAAKSMIELSRAQVGVGVCLCVGGCVQLYFVGGGG
jgi:hypothetical protein